MFIKRNGGDFMWFLTWVKRMFNIFICCAEDNRTDGRKYLVMPMEVISENDGDTHFITAGQLMKLYGVPPKECLVYNDKLIGHVIDGLIKLTPRADGDYSLTNAIIWETRNEIKKEKI